MPHIKLHPRAAPHKKIRVWLGIFDVDELPSSLNWKLNGKETAPSAIRPLCASHKHHARSFTGIFEFELAPHSNNEHEISVSADQQLVAKLKTKPVPNKIRDYDWTRILLTSCYHQAEDREGLVSAAYENIPSAESPDFTVLMGDQVYLDLPALINFPDNEAKLAQKFEGRYQTNWTSPNGLTNILSSAPSVSCPDDHEYWNNFPHLSPHIQNTWKVESRTRWKNAADQLFDAFQTPFPTQRGENFTIDIGELSIMVLDQRSLRSQDKSRTLGPNGLDQLTTWVDHVISENNVGAIVTGQSLLDKAVGKIKGRVADWMLPNYDDYGPIVTELKRLSDGTNRPVLLLTGDVHWGRVTKIKDAGKTKFIEIICSPTSLVTTIGADQSKSIGAGFRKFFMGEDTRWPRHNPAADPEEYFAKQVFGRKFRTETIYKHQGDQFAMLSFRKAAGTLAAKVTYYEIHKEPQQPVDVDLGLLRYNTQG